MTLPESVWTEGRRQEYKALTLKLDLQERQCGGAQKELVVGFGRSALEGDQGSVSSAG